MTSVRRFFERVQVTPGCWLWIGRVDRNGYGDVTQPVGDGVMKRTGAHRWSYEHHVGPIPPGFVIDHLCRNPRCVNPAHLEAVTNRTNILRGVGLSAANAAKTHCKHGHEFSPANTGTYATRYGYKRVCLTCARRRDAERGWRRGAERESA